MALEDSPDICCAVLNAMDEIEKNKTARISKRDGCEQLTEDLKWQHFNATIIGMNVALAILRKHLKENRDINSVKNTIRSEDNDWRKDAERLANVFSEKPIDEIFSLFHQDIADKAEKALEAHRMLVEKDKKHD